MYGLARVNIYWRHHVWLGMCHISVQVRSTHSQAWQVELAYQQAQPVCRLWRNVISSLYVYLQEEVTCFKVGNRVFE